MGSVGALIDGAAGAWLRWMAVMSWQVGILVAAVFVISLFARRASPRFRFFLWSLVLIKLCLPPDLSFVTGIGHWLPVAAPVPLQSITEPISSSGLAPISSAPVSLPTVMPATVANAAAAHHIGWPVVLFGVWVAAALGMLLILVVQYRRLKRQLSDSVPIDDPAILEVMNDAKAKLHVKRSVTLFIAKSVTSPILFGLFRPRIVLPESAMKDLPPAQLRPILLHELSHLKRRDLWLNWAQVVLQMIYWFHPLVWVANLYLRREREMIVDDMVLAHLDGAREAYGDSLLSVVKSASRPRILAAGYVGVIEGRGRIMHRIRRIVDGNRKVSVRLGVVSAAVLVALALILIPLAQKKADAAPADKNKVTVAVDVGAADKVTAAGGKHEDAIARAAAEQAKPTQRELDLEKALNAKVGLEYELPTDLKEVVDFLKEVVKAQTGVANSLKLDPRVVSDQQARQVQITQQDITLRQALTLVLRDASTTEELAANDPLTFFIYPDGAVIYITNRSYMQQMQRKEIRLYDVRELLGILADQMDGNKSASEAQARALLTRLVLDFTGPENWSSAGPQAALPGGMTPTPFEPMPASSPVPSLGRLALYGDGTLLAQQTPEMLGKVETLLQKLLATAKEQQEKDEAMRREKDEAERRGTAPVSTRIAVPTPAAPFGPATVPAPTPPAVR